MTVSSIVPVNNYVGNSSTKNFDFDFLIESEDELVVQHTDKNGVITTLTLGVDYSVNATGNEEGSYITFPLDSSSYSVLSQDETISLILSLVIKQESEFKNSSYFDFTVLEWTFDYIVRILQIINRQIERAVKVQEGSDLDTDELVVNINTLTDNLSAIQAVYNNETNINAAADNEENINTCAENIEDIQNAAENAQTAIKKAAETSIYADNAQIWVEGSDEEVAALGGEHSAKEWANLYSEAADVSLSNLSEVGQGIIDNKSDVDLSNLTSVGQSQYNVFCVNTGEVDDDGNPSFLTLTEISETTTDEETEEETTTTTYTLTTSGSFDVTTANGTIYTISDTLEYTVNDLENGTYKIFIDPVNKSISLTQNKITIGSAFPDDVVSGDYLLNTSKIPYDLQQITITTTTNEETGEETTTAAIAKGLNDVYAGVLTVSGTGNLTLNTYNSEILKLNEIGEPKISLTGKLNENEIWLEGAEVAKTAYPLLYLIYGDTYGTPEDENKFVLPDFRNRVIQGSDEFGYIEAGLPNIYGKVSNIKINGKSASGVLSVSTTSGGNYTTDTASNRVGEITLDASSYNSIYGNSDTVQPPAIKVRVKTRYKL